MPQVKDAAITVAVDQLFLASHIPKIWALAFTEDKIDARLLKKFHFSRGNVLAKLPYSLLLGKGSGLILGGYNHNFLLASSSI